MKYIGRFKDINDRDYFVNIITNNDESQTQEITLGTDPFIVEFEGDSTIYKPCKYSSATIRVVSGDYMFDLYSAAAQENKVILYDSDNNIKWIGYTTPNIYSNGFENDIEEIEIEAIDALSTLQYYDYKPINGTSKEIVSFKDILLSLFRKCNAYSNFYFSDNIQLSLDDDRNILDLLYISEQNFYEDNEDEEAWKMQDVLESICKYFGMTCMAENGCIFIFDYDAIYSNNNGYYKIDIYTKKETYTTIKYHTHITPSSYAENGATISLDNVYNKVTVKSNLYTFDSIIPSLWDDKYLTNYGGDGYMQEINENGKAGKHKVFYKWFKHANYDCYYYRKLDLQQIYPDEIDYLKMSQSYCGAAIAKARFEKVSNFDVKFNSINLTNYLLLVTHNKMNNVEYPMLTLRLNDSYTSFIGGSSYIIIKGNYQLMDREGELYLMSGYMNKGDNFNPNELYIKAKLEFGGLYWNGNEWQHSECTFKLMINDNGQTDHYVNQNFSIKNNIDYKMGLDEEGYAIPMPEPSRVVAGKPTFTLYSPKKVDDDYRCDVVFLSNFDIIAKTPNFSDDKDSDTIYENVINDDFVNEMEEVELDIATWDNKECNFSSAAVIQGDGSFIWLDKVRMKANPQEDKRLEEHLVTRLVNQYSTPNVILELNLKNGMPCYSLASESNFDGKLFIIDSSSINYASNKQTVKLIEKR